MKETTHDSFWKKHTDKVGVAGSLFAALCCLGFPALLSILSAIGLGFFINDAVLLPLLVVFLIVTLGGLYLGVRHHGSWLAFVVGLISAASVFIFIFVAFNKLLAGIGIAGLIAASVLNVWLRMRGEMVAARFRK
jgi:mercuric ion transport protein